MARARSGAAAAGARAELDRGHGNVAVPKIMFAVYFIKRWFEKRGQRSPGAICGAKPALWAATLLRTDGGPPAP